MTPYPSDAVGVSRVAGRIDSVFLFIVVIALIFFFLTQGTLIWFAWRYRRRKGNEGESTPYITGNRLLETLWVVIPSALVLAIFAYGWIVFRDIRTAPAGAADINVVARQWLYEFRYSDGRSSINEVRVPLGKPVRFVLTSSDVLHGFYLPAFRIKQDIVPGRYTDLWVQPEKAGSFDIYCTQYCGTGHSTMRAKMIVMDAADYRRWVAGERKPDLAPPWMKGKGLVERYGCLGCHGVDGVDRIGPTFKGLYGRKVEMSDGSALIADESYFRESILDPTAKVVKGFDPVMPTYKGTLKEDEIAEIIAWLKTVK
ncbi:MAG TPA: cytochrome c oxidase subunit II [Candidatus Deferrimicrobiaceae bacterium]